MGPIAIVRILDKIRISGKIRTELGRFPMLYSTAVVDGKPIRGGAW